ncbi:MAG: group 1 glycosyl transferase [Acidimicrobiaceae bacterium]|nr:MAG: group 1 glycosyl transferase [Acidimicrobiaceae bacterium]
MTHRTEHLPPKRHDGLRLVHLTTTDISLDWLLGPQLRAFAAEGYEVIGMSAAGEHVANLEAMGIRHVPVPAFTRSTNPLQDVRAFVQLVRLLRQVRPDILHTHNPKPGIIGRIAGWLTRVPLVVNTQHGLYAQPTDRWQRRLPVYAAERVAAMFGDAELVQNPEDVDTLVRRLRIPAHKVRLLGNGIDLARFDPHSVPNATRAAVRDDWGVGSDEIVVGVVGRLVREKGIVEILEAAHALHDERLPVRFVIVGPADPGKADAVDGAQMVDARADGVVFAGERTDMPECYAAMDLFLTASWREGFPRSAMEAAAMGLPAVATDIRGNRQVVDDGVTGVLVPARDPAGLAAAVRDLVARRAEWPTMSEAARARARGQFDQALVIERTLAVYRRLQR